MVQYFDIALIVLGTALGFYFIFSGLHKLLDRDAFARILVDYNLGLSRHADAFTIIFSTLEISIGLLILLPMARDVGLCCASLLLAGYAVAILINLLRGNTDIACGCGFSKSDQNISVIHFFRNGLLIITAMLSVMVDQGLMSSPTDWAWMYVSAIGLLLSMLIFSQAMHNTRNLKLLRG
jgi:uncharacterized membrane protein YphA (DoxX/SURF4 family)